MSRGTLDTAAQLMISLTGLSPSMAGFPKTIQLSLVDGVMQSATLYDPRRVRKVWPLPLSLAAT